MRRLYLKLLIKYQFFLQTHDILQLYTVLHHTPPIPSYYARIWKHKASLKSFAHQDLPLVMTNTIFVCQY